MSDERGQIIVLPTGYDPEGDGAVVSKHRPELGACQHKEVEIDKDRHRLVCRRCDEEVDPLGWIEHLAHDWQWYTTRVRMAQQRAKDAEEASERRVAAAQRAGRLNRQMPMPIGRRLARTASSIGRAQSDLGEAFTQLARVHDTGNAGLTDSCLRGAIAHIERARANLAKLHRDHGRAATPA